MSQTIYSTAFKTLVKKCVQENQFVGFGNPSAKILLIGKEVSTDTTSSDKQEIQNTESIKRNASEWAANIEQNKQQADIKNWIFDENLPLSKLDNNPLHPWKGGLLKGTSNTWKNYQKLHDLIFTNDEKEKGEKEITFLKNIFITEMNQTASRTTGVAQKKEGFRKNLEYRKKDIIGSEYFTGFPVIILACSNYIWNIENDWQISNIFNVAFEKKHPISKQNTFYTHYNQNRTKLVIHTRQLSMAVKNELLEKMAVVIKSHLKYLPPSP